MVLICSLRLLPTCTSSGISVPSRGYTNGSIGFGFLCHDHISACQSSSAHECSDEDKKRLVSLQRSTIKQVTQLLESHTYNVAVAQLMIFCNQRSFLEYHCSLEILCTLLAPVAPRIASELWESLVRDQNLWRNGQVGQDL